VDAPNLPSITISSCGYIAIKFIGELAIYAPKALYHLLLCDIFLSLIQAPLSTLLNVILRMKYGRAFESEFLRTGAR
jgi:hypothetical protein